MPPIAAFQCHFLAFLVGAEGFEPSISRSRTACSSRTEPHPERRKLYHAGECSQGLKSKSPSPASRQADAYQPLPS